MIATESHLSKQRPFAGLRPFDFSDSNFFFGREAQVFSLYRLVDRSRFVAVVGSSGSGKSSLVRAGLLPLLQKESQAISGPVWESVTLRPGTEPISALADALAELAAKTDPPQAPGDPHIRRDMIEVALKRSSYGLAKALDLMPGVTGKSVLIVVDQFEELFRYANPGSSRANGRVGDSRWRNEATSFVQLLLEASRMPSRAVHVLITMRSDFIGDCAQFQGLPEAVSASQFLVPSLARDQREDVIRKPIAKAGAEIEDLLVERLLNPNDAGTELDQLPVLQHILLRLWDRAQRSQPKGKAPKLTLEHYAAVGGITGALSQHADEVMHSLQGLDLPVEQTFRALSEVDKEGRATRRAIPFAQLLAETGVAQDELRLVLDRFRADDCSFIVTTPAAITKLQPDTRIDVVHEALLRRWEKISAPPHESLTEGKLEMGWLFAEDADGRFYRALLALLEGKSSSEKITLPLDQVQDRWQWWTERPRTQAWAARYGGQFERVEKLFGDSLEALAAEKARLEHEKTLERERLEQQAQIERERAQMERERAKAAQKFAHRTRAAAIALACIALLAIALGAYAWNASIAATAAKKIAIAKQIDADKQRLIAVRAKTYAQGQRRIATTELGKEIIAAQTARKQTAIAKRQTNIAKTATTKAIEARAQVAKYAEAQRASAGSAELAAIDHALYNNSYDNRVAGLIGTDAYALSHEGDARAVLLTAGIVPSALGRVALPPWNLGAVAGHGLNVAILVSAVQSRHGQPVTGSLVSIDVQTLSVRARTSNVRATLMCGFDVVPYAAVATGSRIDVYDLRPASGPLRVASRATGPVRAMACSPANERVAYVDSTNTLRSADFAAGTADPVLGRVAGTADGINFSPSGRFGVVTTATGNVQLFDFSANRLLESERLLTKPGEDCSPTAGCAGAVTFNYDGSGLAWYDNRAIHLRKLASSSESMKPYKCSSCDHPTLMYFGNSLLPGVVAADGALYPNLSDQTYVLAYDDQAGVQRPGVQRQPLLDRELDMYLTPYNPKKAYQPNPFGGGLATQSFAEIAFPMLGRVEAPQWSGSYGLSGHHALVATTSGFSEYDFNNLRKGLGKAPNLSYRIRIRDSGDGVHAVQYNFHTGLVEVLDIRSSPVTLHRFNVKPVPLFTKKDESGVSHSYYLYDMNVAYDPRGQIVTLLASPYSDSPTKVIQLWRFTADGHPLYTASPKELEKMAGMPASKVINWTLSQRGNYFVIREPTGHMDVIVRSDGRVIGKAYSIDFVSTNEQFALAQSQRRDTLETMYRLSDLSNWSPLLITVVPSKAIRVAVAPDGSTIAFVTRDSDATYSLHVYDAESRVTFRANLPDPPELQRYANLDFSNDGRYLVASYQDKNSSNWLAVYTLDPNAWARSACLMAGRPLSASEFRLFAGSIPYSDGCAPYRSQMYRW